MGQIFSSEVNKDEADNRSLSSHAQGLSHFSWRNESQGLCWDAMATFNEKPLTDIRHYSGSCMDTDFDNESDSSVVNNSSTLYSDQEAEAGDYEEKIRYVISRKHEPIGPSKQVFSSKAKKNTKAEFKNGSNVERKISENIMNKHETRGPTKRVFVSEAENITKVDLVKGSTIEGAISISKDNERTTRPHSRSSVPGRCRIANDFSPHLPVSQKAASSTANMVNTSDNWQNNNKKKGSLGPYNTTQRILLVGEGDFSFSASLAMAFGSASNIIATSLNSLDFLIKNYGNFPTNLSELQTRGSVVLHGVDATKMAKHPHLAMMKFNRIIFNFPHAGFKHDSPESEIRRHQKLVRGFLRNAKIMIEVDGQIHVTHKSNATFLKWGIPNLGLDQGLYLIEEVNFKHSKYPGYHTKFGFGGDKDFYCYPCKTYKFGLTG